MKVIARGRKTPSSSRVGKGVLDSSSLDKHRVWLLASIGIAVLLLAVVVLYSPLKETFAGKGYYTSPTQFSKLEYRTGCVQPPSGIVAWWPAEEECSYDSSTGQTTCPRNHLRDIIGQNSGHYVGYTAGDNTAPGKVGSAFILSGANYIEVPPAPTFNLNGSFTIEMWVQLSPKSDHDPVHGLLSRWNGTAKKGWFINEGGSEPLSAFTFWTNNPRVSNPYVYPLDDDLGPLRITGEWWHYALTFNGRGFQRYIQGQPLYFNTSFGDQWGNFEAVPAELYIHWDIDYPLRIGFSNGSQITAADRRDESNHYTRGLFDEVTFYNRALSPEEIRAIYNAGSAGKCQVSTTIVPCTSDNLALCSTSMLCQNAGGVWDNDNNRCRSCSSNSECGVGLACVSGLCQTGTSVCRDTDERDDPSIPGTVRIITPGWEDQARGDECLPGNTGVTQYSCTSQNTLTSPINTPCLSGTVCSNGACRAPAVALGDVNGDSNIDNRDAILLKRHVRGRSALPAEQQSRADVNHCVEGGAGLDNRDLILLLRKIRRSTPLPCT